ncbi:MAG: peptidylprolyl isomerase [Proteobacteria bacterium]|nr:peptidylprolyl isomerase [Pseudomonadota bacterium]
MIAKDRVAWLVSLGVSVVSGFLIWYLVGGTHITGVVQGEKILDLSENEDTPVITVGSQVVTIGDIDFEHKLLTQVVTDDQEHIQDSSTRQESSWRNIRQFLLQAIIKRKVLFFMVKQDRDFNLRDPELHRSCYKEGQKFLAANPNFFARHDYRKKMELRICETYMIERYVQDLLTAGVSVSGERVKQYYITHRSRFLSPKKVIIRHIHLVNEGGARRVHALVRPSNFAQLAKKHSIAPEAKEGGLLGPYAAREVPRFLVDGFNLPLGRVSPIIKSAYGYHIILPLKKFAERIKSFDEVKSEIEESLVKEQKKQIYEDWLNRALNTVSITSEPYMLMGGL